MSAQDAMALDRVAIMEAAWAASRGAWAASIGQAKEGDLVRLAADAAVKEALRQVAESVDSVARRIQAHHVAKGKATSNRQAMRSARNGHQVAAATSIARQLRELADAPDGKHDEEEL